MAARQAPKKGRTGVLLIGVQMIPMAPGSIFAPVEARKGRANLCSNGCARLRIIVDLTIVMMDAILLCRAPSLAGAPEAMDRGC